MSERVISVAIVDDAPDSRELIEALFVDDDGIEMTGSASTLEEARTLLTTAAPDVLLLDLNLAGESGLDLIEDALEVGSAVVVISALDGLTAVKTAIRAGATAFVTKGTPRNQLRRAIVGAAHGETILPDETVHEIVDRLSQPPDTNN